MVKRGDERKSRNKMQTAGKWGLKCFDVGKMVKAHRSSLGAQTQATETSSTENACARADLLLLFLSTLRGCDITWRESRLGQRLELRLNKRLSEETAILINMP